MKTLDGLSQGSDQWLAVRRGYLCASEAAAMMGYDKKTSRTELLRLKSTGAEREFSDWVQKNLLDRGHEIEAFARGIAETLIGEELYPCTGTLDIDGLKLLASFDGIVMDESAVWECKTRNADLVKAVAEGNLPDSHWPQIEHQLLICGASRALFMISDGTEEGTRVHWYVSMPERRAQLLASWKQFVADMGAYRHVEDAPAAIARPIEDLPALTVELVGQVKNSNLVSFKAAVMTRIQSINTDLQTDEDFATADKMVKFLDDGENRLDLVKSQALAQTSSIDELFRTIDALKEEMRAKRLKLNALVKTRKELIRTEIAHAGSAAAQEHIDSLNARLGRAYMPLVPRDFVGAMRGKKTIASLRDAVNTELARLKIEANALADRIQVNINYLAECGAGKEFLFSDTHTIVLKAPDDFKALCKNRLAEHKEKEERRITEDRERIRKEEVDRLERERLARPDGGPVAFNVQREPALPAPKSPFLQRAAEAPRPHVVQRPEDEVIIHLLALTYGVNVREIIQWLREMDLDAVAKRMSEVA